MRMCLGKSVEDIETEDILDVHMSNLCPPCFAKWEDFANHSELATQSDTALRSGLVGANINGLVH